MNFEHMNTDYFELTRVNLGLGFSIPLIDPESATSLTLRASSNRKLAILTGTGASGVRSLL